MKVEVCIKMCLWPDVVANAIVDVLMKMAHTVGVVVLPRE